MKFLILPENHSLSHAAKGLAVAEALQAAGHEVLLGVGGARAAFLEGRGVPFRVLPDIQGVDRSGYPTAAWFRDPLRLEACIRAEVALIEAYRPDRVLGVFRCTARASTTLAGVPYDALTCGCMLPEYEEVLGFGPDDPGREEQAFCLRSFYRFAGRRASQALARLGLEAVPDLRWMLKGDRTFLWDFPEFAPLPPGTAATHVGPVIWQGWSRDCPDLEGVLASPLPLAIVTFGTCVNSARTSARMVALLLAQGFQVVLAAGGQDPLLEGVGRHPHLTVCGFAPLHLLFPKAALTVCHGGQLTVFEALAARCPVLVLPLQPEQAHNGLCLARLGCGRSLVPPRPFMGHSRVYTDAFEALDDGALRGMLEAFLATPGLEARLAEAQTLVQAYRGAGTLAALLEKGLTMALGILLVHGYTGSPADLEPLARLLEARHGADAVRCPALPGHRDGLGEAPPFDRDRFRATLLDAAAGLLAEGRRLVLVGHSTGGTLLLDALDGLAEPPALLVLMGVPRRMGPADLERWQHHREGTAALPFIQSVRLASLINAVGARVHPGPRAVLVVHGEADELVPPAAGDWQAQRTVLVPGAGHHLLRGPGSALALEVVDRAIQDLAGPWPELASWAALEPGLGAFLAHHPAAARHLARSPQTGTAELTERADWEPLRAHIEVTTRCNLGCGHCARNWHARPAEDMPLERFRRVLDLLPHACPITLVGLGEPLLHPRLPELVAEAARQHRQVTVASNALALTPELASRLVDAGLAGFAFSLDTVAEDLVGRVRPGSRLETILAHIRQMADLAPQVGRAVFAAVSTATLPRLEALVETVATLGVQVLMLTDLNFRENLDQTLWRNDSPALRALLRQAVRKAFALGLPVLSVRGMEAIGLAARYREFLLAPDQLFRRSATRTWCQSPWQTLPVAVDGSLTLCDCQPGAGIGSLLGQPLEETWNGPAMRSHRLGMLGHEPPEVCRICPRF